MSERLSKRQRKTKQQNINNEDIALRVQFNLKEIKPITITQSKVFEAYKTKNLLLHGYAGTGKSFISLYLALNDLFAEESKFKKIILIKSIVPVRDIGFLPGTAQEKTEIYEEPYRAMFQELFKRRDAYDYFKSRGIIEFVPTSFIRGLTLNNAIVILDEIQNCSWMELSSTITRLGINTKIIFCGDYRQSDLKFKEKDDKKAVHDFMDVLEAMPDDFKSIEFGVKDIIRSQLVKNFIIAADNLGLFDL